MLTNADDWFGRHGDGFDKRGAGDDVRRLVGQPRLDEERQAHLPY